jgi:hypothetical protein
MVVTDALRAARDVIILVDMSTINYSTVQYEYYIYIVYVVRAIIIFRASDPYQVFPKILGLTPDRIKKI